MDANQREFFQCLELLSCLADFNFHDIANNNRENALLIMRFHDIHIDFQCLEKTQPIFPNLGRARSPPAPTKFGL